VKTLVTGATGFLGAAVVRSLLSKKFDVRVMARQSSVLSNITGLAVDRVEADLQDEKSLDQALLGCQALFHVAADYRLWVPKPKEMYQTNVLGTKNLMSAALRAGVSKIVYTSSVAVLGKCNGSIPADEDTPVKFQDMIGHYKKSKFLAEEEVRKMIRNNGLPAVIVNPSTPIGPRDIKPTPTGKIIIDFLNGKMPAYVDTGLNIVHVDDCALGHILAMRNGEIGERYILGGEDMSLKNILEALSSITSKKVPTLHLPHNSVIPIAYLSELIARLFGSEPIITLDAVRMSKRNMFFSSEKAKSKIGYIPGPSHKAFIDAVEWFHKRGYVKVGLSSK
tara:strand:- start:122 stop:1129 length:1008 start_codon:yes stop_codon:yes gene_type:complete